MFETASGIAGRRSRGGTGRLAMWLCTSSSGSVAENGRTRVSISYSVTPSE